MKPLKITQSFTDRDSLALTKYLNDISKYNPIPIEKEVELAQRIKKGDQNAVSELVSANLRFVVSVAKQYQNRGVALPDLINEGNLGLMKAAKKFDETRGFKFISFAVWWIRQAILEQIHNNGKIVRIPVNKNNLAAKFVKTYSDLEQQMQRNPTEAEVFEAMGEDAKDVDMAVLLNRSYSIDTKITEDEDSTFADLLTSDDMPKPDGVLQSESLKSDVNDALVDLSEKERIVLKMFFGIGETEKSLADIADDLDYTSERIRQIKEGALKKLRNRGNVQKLKTYL